MTESDSMWARITATLRLAALLALGVSGGCGTDPAPKEHSFAVMTDCGTCHMDSWQQSQQPPHAELALPKTCDDCHSTTQWPGASFEIHDQFFELTGQHAKLACEDCHADGHFSGTSAGCYDCHASEYTHADGHVSQGFPKACSVCHNTTRWEPPTWKGHDALWPLTGKHAKVKCSTCHGDDPREETPTACVGCHQADYDSTDDPDHAVSGFPTTCEACHTTTAWEPASYAGHDQYWPLVGQHADTACTSCHVGGVYEGTPRECKGCHLPDYQGAKDPDHVAQGYPTTCDACHTPTGWSPASFTNHDAFWPLVGKHATASCDGCHGGGVYEGTTKVCSGCHLPDWNATSNPDHGAVGIPQTCDTCHTPASWDTNKFPGHNTLFPITSGPHKSISCASCHKGQTWETFNCIACHNAAKMKSEHNEVSGYSAALTAGPTPDHGCLKCHPNGTSNDD